MSREQLETMFRNMSPDEKANFLERYADYLDAVRIQRDTNIPQMLEFLDTHDYAYHFFNQDPTQS